MDVNGYLSKVREKKSHTKCLKNEILPISITCTKDKMFCWTSSICGFSVNHQKEENSHQN